MRQATDILVHEIYDKDWKFGQVTPLPNAVPLERLLMVVSEEGVMMRAEPGSELEGGPYDGGHVIRIEARDRPMYYMMPPEAIPLLRGYMQQGDYHDVVQRTPKLRRSR